jgi:hypothetical protein
MSYKKRVSLFLIMSIALIGTLGDRSLAQRKKNIAIFDFDFNTADQGPVYHAYGDIRNLSRQISDRLDVNLVSLGSYLVVERRQVEKVMREQDYGQAGRIDLNTAAKVGRILGVDALIIGSITLLEFQGLPKNGYGDPNWSPKRLRAKIVLSFRMVDSSTAEVQLAQEVVGLSATQAETDRANRGEVTERVVDGVVDGLIDKYGWRLPIPINKSPDVREPTTEDFKRVINLAVEDAVAKMAQHLGKAESYVHARYRTPDAPLISGRVLRVKATAVFVSGVSSSNVKIGDRLFVRRFHIATDPHTGREVHYSEKIGELEVTEIQDQVIVGTFSGAEAVRIGDAVTNR